MTVKVTGEQTVGQSVVLECKIEAAIDTDSTIDIIWTTGNDSEVRRLKNVPGHLLYNYSDFFSTPLLSRNDENRRYQCEVITHTSPQAKENGSVTLNVTCKFKKKIIVMFAKPIVLQPFVSIQKFIYCTPDHRNLVCLQFLILSTI